VKNVFDEWRIFRGFDTTRSIIDLTRSIIDFSNDESSIKDLAFFFHFASCKKGWQLVSSNQVTFTFLDVFNLIVLFVFSIFFRV
jgi:hypothetical protein